MLVAAMVAVMVCAYAAGNSDNRKQHTFWLGMTFIVGLIAVLAEAGFK